MQLIHLCTLWLALFLSWSTTARWLSLWMNAKGLVQHHLAPWLFRHIHLWACKRVFWNKLNDESKTYHSPKHCLLGLPRTGPSPLTGQFSYIVQCTSMLANPPQPLQMGGRSGESVVHVEGPQAAAPFWLDLQTQFSAAPAACWGFRWVWHNQAEALRVNKQLFAFSL